MFSALGLVVPSTARKLTRGYFNVVRVEGETLRIEGWMLRIDQPFTEFELRLNGARTARQPVKDPDGHFDLVVAYSVFTHLPSEVQKAWLAEMRHVLDPGGLLLATVHGEFSALFNFPTQARQNPRGRLDRLLGHGHFIEGGITDSVQDRALDGIAPEGYYRSVVQTRRYTVREWSRFLDVIEFREAGVGNLQDLVVLQRPHS